MLFNQCIRGCSGADDDDDDYPFPNASNESERILRGAYRPRSRQRPHSTLCHPHMTTSDKIASEVARRTYRFDALTQDVKEVFQTGKNFKPEGFIREDSMSNLRQFDVPEQSRPEKRSVEEARMKKVKQQAQRTTAQLMIYQHRKHVMQPINKVEYEKKCTELAQSQWRWGTETYRLQRIPDILVQWGLVDSRDERQQQVQDTGGPLRIRRHVDTVKVVLHGPSSIVSPVPSEGAPQSSPSVGFPQLTVRQIAASQAPILLWFHGGGMMFGSAEDPLALGFAQSMLEKADNADRKLLIVSVEMGLAPEKAFPHGVVDCLSAAETVLDAFGSTNEFHVGGLSSGGNFAAVVAMECCRKYPGRIKSACIIDPMLCPEADSKSYYMNSTTSGIVPVAWLRWAWRLYLGLEGSSDDNGEDDLPEGLFNSSCLMNSCGIPVEATRSNRVDVSRVFPIGLDNYGSMHASNWRRLISPQVDIPNEIAATSSETSAAGPKFIVTTCKADPLHDDGVELVKALKNGKADVLHIESSGSHVIGRMFDKAANEALIQSWSKALWN